MRYKAFISYSHAADGHLAPALQSALHRFARPWNKIRALHVFRDQSNLSTSPGLWSSVQQALSDSEYFILLASPQAAGSKWVRKEIEFWLAQRSPKTLLVVLTDGNIAWNDAGNDFDWNQTDALPQELSRVFQEEPFLLDLRWAKRATDLSLKNPDFLGAVSTLAATLHGRPKDELVGQDVSQHRFVRRLVRFTIGVLGLLTVFLAATAWFAWQQRTVARSRELAATALLASTGNQQLGVRLAMDALEVSPTEQAVQALRDTLIRASVRTELDELMTAAQYSRHGGQATEFGKEMVGRTGKFVLSSGDSRSLRVVDAGTNKEISKFDRHFQYVSSVDFNPDDTLAVSVDEDGVGHIWETRSGKSIGVLQGARSHQGFAAVAWSPDGKYIVTGHNDRTAQVWEAGSWKKLVSFSEHTGSVDRIAISPDSELVLTASTAVAQGPPLDRIAYVWKRQTGDILIRLPDIRRVIDEVGFTPNSALALTGYSDGMAQLWDVKTGDLAAIRNGDEFTVSSRLNERTFTVDAAGYNPSGEDPFGVANLAFTRSGDFLITADGDGAAKVWNVQTWTDLSPAPEDMEKEVDAFLANGPNKSSQAISRDGRFAVQLGDESGNDPGGLVKETASGRVIGNVQGNSARVVAAAFSPDLTRIAIADGTPDVRVYRWETIAPLSDLIALAKARLKREP